MNKFNHDWSNNGKNKKIDSVHEIESSYRSFTESVENRIYFYSEVTTESVLQFNRKLKEIDNTNLSEKYKKEMDFHIPIYININSLGGEIFSGLSAMDNINQCKSPTVTIVDGACASAATFLSIAGTKRMITKHSTMLIHQISTMWWGSYKEFKDEIKNLDLFMNIIKGIYLSKTKIPEKKLNEILEHDLFFDAKTCLKYGLVDKII